MFSLSDIYQRDAATYYDYASNARISRGKTFTAYIVFALIIGFTIGEASNDFLAGALSAQAILVGFSFNVLFYLVANRLTKPAAYASLEHELRFDRLSKLSDEVFDNVTYFNIVAIASAVAALGLLLIGSDDFNANLHRAAAFIESRTCITKEALGWADYVLRSTGLAVLAFLMVESVCTFLRTVGRVRFYFGMLKTMNDDIQP